ncbi:hypothetical protein NCWK1_0647 [Nostoc cycadae WK-1]|uniref:Uncharacterized protein n=1 Tax=Nostoc cycadae WK-1 TaxID=1861711 RepID=A0A2H6LCG1_9NOSO|nr:hypothetical protein NCWK1_0647 [Nostoc cycadae WK-1]
MDKVNILDYGLLTFDQISNLYREICVKDNLSLIAAAAGGFMLSMALTGILRGTPVIALQGQSQANNYPVVNLQVASVRSDEKVDYNLEEHK